MLRKSWLVSVAFVVVVMFSIGALAEVPMGTWVDEVILIEEPSPSQAITRLQVGDIDLYANTVSDIGTFQTVRQDPALSYYRAFGSYSEITFNTVGPYFNDGRFNPFHNRGIREAMNMLIDREYIAEEIYGGLAVPKYTLLSSLFADYARIAENIRELEIQYGHNPSSAERMIRLEMQSMGAELVNGIWHYDGEPVELKFLIRTEDERLGMGDYVAALLEDIGFVVERNYRTGAEASPIWLLADPWDGLFSLYTGGWISPSVARDQGHIFNQMYTDHTMSFPLWQELDPIPELVELSDMLFRKEYTSMEERAELFTRAIELAFQDSPRIFTVDVASFVPRRADISVASDLAGHVSGTSLWASTIRRGDEIGGTVRIALPQLLVEPWNPVAGSNWTFDQMPIRATMDRAIITDPFTGLFWPQRLEKADVYVVDGLPVGQTLDWVNLNFVEEISVPGDAYVDWDPVAQRFITVDEKYPDGVSTLRMNRAYFDENFWEEAKWHDGSPVSIGDFMFWLALEFDRGFEESDIFDASHVSSLETMQRSFRGVRVVSEDPFILEYYSDLWNLDAENNVSAMFPIQFNYGKAPWHTLALGVLAETAGELAFSQDKASRLETEFLGMHMGPSLPILAKYLDVAEEEVYIPYEPFLSKYISEEEAAMRYANARAWYEDKGHFWLGDGPLYLERAFGVEGTIQLRRNPLYSIPADRWSGFDEPRIAEVDVSGARRVVGGVESVFTVDVTFAGEPYALEDIIEVKYIIIDARGNVAMSGLAEAVEDGLFQVVLTGDQISNLPIGSNQLEVIVSPTLVGGASFGQHTFVSLP